MLFYVQRTLGTRRPLRTRVYARIHPAAMLSPASGFNDNIYANQRTNRHYVNLITCIRRDLCVHKHKRTHPHTYTPPPAPPPRLFLRHDNGIKIRTRVRRAKRTHDNEITIIIIISAGAYGGGVRCHERAYTWHGRYQTE